MPHVTFVTATGDRHEIEADTGLSVMQVGRMHDLGIEGTCDGSLACATCHVIVDPAFVGLLDDASPEEEDMLDLAVGVEPHSRLGCQIVLSEALDGLTVRLPDEV
jgi:2Fe-2S ferredoxin